MFVIKRIPSHFISPFYLHRIWLKQGEIILRLTPFIFIFSFFEFFFLQMVLFLDVFFCMLSDTLASGRDYRLQLLRAIYLFLP